MKFKKLLLIPLIASPLMMAGCSGDNGGIPESGDFTITFYLDYNHYDEENPYYVVWWDYDKPFSKDQIGLKDPTEAPEPYYPTFLGWSRYALVDEETNLWKFGEDVVTKDMVVGENINLFGIFVGK